MGPARRRRAQRRSRAREGRASADLRAQQASQKAGGAHEFAAERVRTVYRTIERKVPTHVTAEIDARFPVPVGFVRVHDAAALGLPSLMSMTPPGDLMTPPRTLQAAEPPASSPATTRPAPTPPKG
jgi:hypothetical protein